MNPRACLLIIGLAVTAGGCAGVSTGHSCIEPLGCQGIEIVALLASWSEVHRTQERSHQQYRPYRPGPAPSGFGACGEGRVPGCVPLRARPPSDRIDWDDTLARARAECRASGNWRACNVADLAPSR